MDGSPRRSAVRGQGDEDAQAFTDQVRPHLAAVASVARRLAPVAADDVVQETLLAAWRHRSGHDERRGSFRAWLLAITVRESRREAERGRRRLRLVDRVVASTPPAAVLSGGGYRLEEAIALLSRRQREVIALHDYVDLPVEEVAAVLQVSVGTVKSTLSDARRRLSLRLEEA